MSNLNVNGIIKVGSGAGHRVLSNNYKPSLSYSTRTVDFGIYLDNTATFDFRTFGSTSAGDDYNLSLASNETVCAVDVCPMSGGSSNEGKTTYNKYMWCVSDIAIYPSLSISFIRGTADNTSIRIGVYVRVTILQCTYTFPQYSGTIKLRASQIRCNNTPVCHDGISLSNIPNTFVVKKFVEDLTSTSEIVQMLHNSSIIGAPKFMITGALVCTYTDTSNNSDRTDCIWQLDPTSPIDTDVNTGFITVKIKRNYSYNGAAANANSAYVYLFYIV